MIKPVILWSDILIFVLVLSVGIFIRLISRNELSRQRWKKVFRSRIGMAAFVVVCGYILVALLDSLHFREPLAPLQEQQHQETHYSQELKSALDVMIGALNKNEEKTYSEPFALFSFARENMVDSQGHSYRDFPRLQSAGAAIVDERQQRADILLRTGQSLGTAFLLIALMIGAHIAWRRRTAIDGRQPLPWLTAYITLSLIIIMASWCVWVGSAYHILGTDKVGSDVLYQSIKAIRTGVLIGTLATILTLPLAIVLGISAGYFKGWVDDVVQYVYTTLSSIPGILLIAASVLLIDVYIQTHQQNFSLSIERADFKFLALCLILGLTSWTGLCRLLRAETLKVSQLEYIQAAHAFGVAHHLILRKHILPNITHIILISLVLDFSGFVLAEAVLSYIGVGVDPSMHSWGNMINAARTELSRDPTVWWSVTSAFILMFVLVLAANLFADRVRDAFDPRTV